MQEIRDGDWVLFDHDQALGRTVWACNDGGRTVFRIDYNVSELIEQNKDALSESNGKRFGDWARVASVPLNVFYDSGLHDAMQASDDKYIAKYLNDSDNAAWRTHWGKI